MSSQRVKKVESVMRREISDVITHELRDPRLVGVTVIDVVAAPDLKRATVYYRIVDMHDETRKAAGEALGKAKSAVRKIVGDRMSMKYTPEIDFKYDATEDKAQKIEDLLNTIKRDEESE